MKIIFLTLLFAFSLFADYQDIDNEKLAKLKSNGAIIVDTRLQVEWEDDGIIAGSALITSHTDNGFEYEAFKNELIKRGINDNFVIVCQTGRRSKEVADRLSADGYKNFYNLQYGIVGWKREKRPVVKYLIY